MTFQEMLIIALFIALMILSIGIGAFISAIIGFTYRSKIELFAFSTGIGLLAISVLGFLLGISDAFSLSPLLVCLVVMAVLSVLGFRRMQNLTVEVNQSQRELPNIIWIAVIVYVAFVIGTGLLGALAPETIWDAHSYHLDVPKRWVESGGMNSIPYLFYSNWPLNLSAIYALEMIVVQGTTLPQLTHFSFVILVSLLIWSFAKSKFGNATAIAATVLFLSTPVLFWLMTTAISDLAVAYFLFGGLIAAAYFADSSNSRWLVLAGMLTGAAMGTKLTGLLGFLTMFCLLFWYHISRVDLRRHLAKNLVIFSTIAFSFALPWYLKSYIQSGDPIFPFGFDLFHGSYWSAAIHENFMSQQLNYMGANRTFLDYLLLPFRLLLDGSRQIEGPISWVYLAGLPFALIKSKERTIKILLIFSIIYFVFWAMFSTQVVRMLLPALAALSIATTAGILAAFKRSRFYNLLLFLFLALIMTQGVIQGWVPRYLTIRDQIDLQLGKISREDYLHRHFELAEAVDYINNLPDDGAILAYNEVRGYLIDREFIWGHPDMQGYLDYSMLDTEMELINRLEELGVKYILVHKVHYPNDANGLRPVSRVMVPLATIDPVDIYVLDIPD